MSSLFIRILKKTGWFYGRQDKESGRLQAWEGKRGFSTGEKGKEFAEKQMENAEYILNLVDGYLKGL